MRSELALVLLLAACGEGRDVPPPGGDGGTPGVQAPRLDSGTGDCREDYRITMDYIIGLDAPVEREAALMRATLDLYGTCIGPHQACVVRCGLDFVGETQAECMRSCPPAPDAG
jgi:hypothetical protein